MKGVALGAAGGFFALGVGMGVGMAEMAAVGQIKQIAQAERVVGRESQAALVFAGGFAAGVVHTERQAVGQQPLPPGNNDVAFIRRVCRNDLDIGFRGRYALEIFQPLLDTAQIQNIAAFQRNFVLKGGNARGTGLVVVRSISANRAHFAGQNG